MSAPETTGSPGEETWQYHLPAFLDTLRAEGQLDLRQRAPGPFEGFLYHHRGARIPANEARLRWTGDGFGLELEALDGTRWTVRFHDRDDWDAYLVKLAGDEPALAWMTDAEFHEEEADEHAAKEHAVGRGRFSFGLYFESQRTWRNLVERLADRQRSLVFLRPSGRTYVPPDGFDLDHEIVPEELRPGDEQAPGYLGLEEVERKRKGTQG